METTNITENMQNAEANESKSNRVTKLAAAAILGVALGAGTQAVAANLHPDEPVQPEIDDDVTTEEPAAQTAQAQPQVVEHHHVDHVIVHDPEIVVVPVPVPEPTPGPDPVDPDIQFLEHGQIDLGDGIVADAVSFTMNGLYGVVLDVDRDGIADSIVFDRNNDGSFSADEITIIEPENRFQMAELVAEIDNKNVDDLPDYTKDMDDAAALAAEEEEQTSEEETENEDVNVVEENAADDQVKEAETVDEDVVADDNNVADDDIAVAEEVSEDEMGEVIPEEAIAEGPEDATVESFSADDNTDGMPAVDEPAMEDYSANDDFSAGADVADPDML